VTRALASLVRAPRRRKAMALEAVVELLWARVAAMLPARIYTREFGRIGAAPAEMECPEIAVEVGRTVAAVAAVLPIGIRCLHEAIAARRMLRRRGVPASVCLGVSLDPARRAEPARGKAAHAWVEVGSRVVSGDRDLADYAVVARFS